MSVGADNTPATDEELEQLFFAEAIFLWSVERGDVETIFRSFQFAPGEVGLVEAHFALNDPSHGVIIYDR